MKHITLSYSEWDTIFNKIKLEYNSTPSVYLIRDKMRSVLGFTVREHRRTANEDNIDIRDIRDMFGEIHIDFYNEQAKTMFILKYHGK